MFCFFIYYLEKYPNLLSLSLNDCALKSLENFPQLPKLLKVNTIKLIKSDFLFDKARNHR